MTQTITIDADKGREIALTVAEAIRRACGKIIDDNGDHADLLDDTCDAAVDAAMQALADAFVPGIYALAPARYDGILWTPAREAEARAHYEGWDDQLGYVPWVPGGNSEKQNAARTIVVKRVLAVEAL